MNIIEWTALRDFVAVAEAGSLSGAARKLGISQPTIGRRIEQLERHLNALLVNRTPQGLTLTETGERILIYAQRMSDEAVSIERLASGANQRLEGSVRITLTDMMGNQWLPTKLSEFYLRYPGMHLEVVIDNRLLDLIKREADIAVRFARPKQLDLVTRRSVDYHYGLYASTDYLERYNRPEHIRDFKQHYFVSYDETLSRFPLLKRLEKLFGQDRIIHRSTSNTGVMAAITEGVGLGISGCYFSDSEPKLERLLPQRFDYSFETWVTTHADIYKSARIKAVFDFLIEKLEEDADLFAGVRQ